MAKQERRGRLFWEEIVEEHGRSGQTAAEFGRDRGLNANTLAWWRWRLRAARSRRKQALVRFVSVVAAPPPTPSVEIVLPGGAVVRAPGEGLEFTVRAVVAATRC